ncbi:MAG TPA: HD domain-containing protein [Thermoleophilaceae bacterium]|jgi:putative nucleotidyltransferase with HDIG domain
MSGPLERLADAPPVRAVRDALAGAGTPGWIVGGTVRDAMLERPIADVDVAVDGSPEDAARAVARAARGPAFQLSETFGAWRAIGGGGEWICDVSPLQAPTIEEDLALRDFSVNAMAVPVSEGGTLLDPVGGAGDLERRVLRVLGGGSVEESAYARDPLRPLRLARLATELGFAPDSETERLTLAAAERVTRASPERVFAELRRLVLAERVLEGVELADRLGLLAAVLPELDGLHGVEQSAYHHLDVYGHSIEVLRQLLEIERDPAAVFGPELAARVGSALEEPLADELTRGQALRFAALLHDCGKPATRGVLPDGRVSFIGHDTVGADQIRALCRRLRTSDRLGAFLADVTRHHLVLGFMVHERPLSRAAVHRYMTTCQPVELEVTVLSCADRMATRGRNADAAIAVHLEVARTLTDEALAWRRDGPPRSPIRGDELARELDIQAGPELGALLARLEEAAFTGEATTREAALDLARRLRDNPAR